MDNNSSIVSIDYQEEKKPDSMKDALLDIKDVTQIKRLVRLIDSSDIEEIEVKQGNGRGRLVLRRLKTPIYLTQANESPQGDTILLADEPADAAHLHQIKAPMVGVFHNGLKPKGKAFVTVGDLVKVGQVIGTIEALTISNELETMVAGRVIEISVEHGQAVEYGQPLITIDCSNQKTS